jgi:hypothetical protein
MLCCIVWSCLLYIVFSVAAFPYGGQQYDDGFDQVVSEYANFQRGAESEYTEQSGKGMRTLYSREAQVQNRLQFGYARFEMISF